MRRTALALATLALSGPALAEDASDWQGRVVLYGWFAGLDGTVAARESGLSSSLSLSSSEVLERLDLGLFAHGELQRGRFGTLLDVAYIELSDAQNVSVPAPGRISADTTLALVTAAGFWRAINETQVTLDLYTGARFVSVDVGLGATVTGGPARSVGADDSWVDPIVGLRVTVPLTERLTVTALADIGGFGIGSEVSAQVFGGISWQFTERFSAEAGLRYLRIDREADRLDFDADLWGPTVGLAFSF